MWRELSAPRISRAADAVRAGERERRSFGHRFGVRIGQRLRDGDVEHGGTGRVLPRHRHGGDRHQHDHNYWRSGRSWHGGSDERADGERQYRCYGSYNGYIIEIPNGSTATVANKLAKMFGANTVTVGTSGDTDGMIGVVVGGAGTTGNAQIAINGQALCAFNSAPTGIGDFVTISSTTAGACHDSGTKVRSGLTSQIIGQVVNTTASGGNYAVALNLNGVGGGSAQWTTSGSNIYNNNTGYVGIGTTEPSYIIGCCAFWRSRGHGA